MFTGLVEELGTVRGIRRGAESVQLSINANKVIVNAALGDSIAVNGACLTVVELAPDGFTADVMPETMDRTVLGVLRPGDQVNLERTLRLGDRLGGHLVSGHIDGVGDIREKQRRDIAILYDIKAPATVMRYIVEKGSVSIDGISLTVAACGRDWFRVSLIPHTAAMTTLGTKRAGDKVNLEADMIGKYIEKFLGRDQQYEPQEGRVNFDFLRDNGFD